MSVSSWPSLAMWRNNLCPACGTTFGSEPDCRLRNFVVPCHSGFPGPKQGGLFVAMSFFFPEGKSHGAAVFPLKDIEFFQLWKRQQCKWCKWLGLSFQGLNVTTDLCCNQKVWKTPKENGPPGFTQTQGECPVEALTLANCHAPRLLCHHAEGFSVSNGLEKPLVGRSTCFLTASTSEAS